MSIEFEVFPDTRRVDCVIRHSLRGDDLWPFIRDVLAAEAFGPGFDALVDMREVHEVEVDNEDLNRLSSMVDLVEKAFEGARVAIVAQHPDLRDWIGRYIRMRSTSPYTLRHFDDMERATDWLAPSPH